jgi:hypothetical protein
MSGTVCAGGFFPKFGVPGNGGAAKQRPATDVQGWGDLLRDGLVHRVPHSQPVG